MKKIFKKIWDGIKPDSITEEQRKQDEFRVKTPYGVFSFPKESEEKLMKIMEAKDEEDLLNKLNDEKLCKRKMQQLKHL